MEIKLLYFKKEKVGVFENIFYGFNFYISDDEKEIVYVKAKRRGKLIMIENAFVESGLTVEDF